MSNPSILKLRWFTDSIALESESKSNELTSEFLGESLSFLIIFLFSFISKLNNWFVTSNCKLIECGKLSKSYRLSFSSFISISNLSKFLPCSKLICDSPFPLKYNIEIGSSFIFFKYKYNLSCNLKSHDFDASITNNISDGSASFVTNGFDSKWDSVDSIPNTLVDNNVGTIVNSPVFDVILI